MERVIAMGASSTSVIYGTVGHAIRELIYSQLPKDLIKDYFVSSEIGYRSIRRFLGTNTYTEMRKREKPALVIQPQFQSQETDSFLNNTNVGRNVLNINGGIDRRFLSVLMDDPENGYKVLYRINHDKITYECRIIVNTLNEQLDLYNNMRNGTSWDITGYHIAAMESLIPRTVVGQIAALCNMDIDNPNHIAPLVLRMNSVSRNPITYKMKNASSTDEFFMYFMHNLLVTFTDLDRGSANKKNMVDDYYEVSFRVEVSFNMPAVYFIVANNKRALDLQIDVSAYNPYGEADYIPLYCIKNIYSQYPPRIDDKQYYMCIVFHVSEDMDKDEISLADNLKDTQDQFTIHDILTDAFHHGENTDTIIKLYMMKDDKKMETPTDFYFDAERQTVEIYTLDQYSTYRIFIYINNQYINRRREIYQNSKRTDRPKL